MGAYFLDSSALVKRYAHEPGTNFLIKLFRDKPENIIFVSRITLVEVTSALIRKAHAQQISIESESRSSRRLHRGFHRHFGTVEVTEDLILEAVAMARRHRLRGYDAVQLASAIEISKNWKASGLKPLAFVSADSDLNTAALSEGFPVINPNNYP